MRGRRGKSFTAPLRRHPYKLFPRQLDLLAYIAEGYTITHDTDEEWRDYAWRVEPGETFMAARVVEKMEALGLVALRREKLELTEAGWRAYATAQAQGRYVQTG